MQARGAQFKDKQFEITSEQYIWRIGRCAIYGNRILFALHLLMRSHSEIVINIKPFIVLTCVLHTPGLRLGEGFCGDCTFVFRQPSPCEDEDSAQTSVCINKYFRGFAVRFKCEFIVYIPSTDKLGLLQHPNPKLLLIINLIRHRSTTLGSVRLNARGGKNYANESRREEKVPGKVCNIFP